MMKVGYFIVGLASAMIAGTGAARAVGTFEIGGVGLHAPGSFALDRNQIAGGTGIGSIANTQFSTGTLGVSGGGTNVSVYYLGSKSGFNVSLTSGGGGFTETNADAVNYNTAISNGPVMSFAAGAGGSLAFAFDNVQVAGGATGALDNASVGLSDPAHVAYAYFDIATGNVTGTKTDWVLFALDDGGSKIDLDFDDYVGLMHVTPLPAGVWLMGSAIASLMAARRLRKPQQA